MSTLPAEALDQMVCIIVQKVDPETVILFGSHAQGVARTDSDIDLMVIEQAPFSAQREGKVLHSKNPAPWAIQPAALRQIKMRKLAMCRLLRARRIRPIPHTDPELGSCS